MSRNKPLAFAAAILLSANALGQGSPITIGEATNHRSEVQRARWQADLSELKAKGGGTPARVAKTCDEDLEMYSVYGVGDKLRADFGYRGVTTTLSAGDLREVGGWRVEELTSTRAITVKRVKGKVTARCPVYLAAPVKPFAALPGLSGPPGLPESSGAEPVPAILLPVDKK